MNKPDLKALTGLRFFAAVAVFIHHIFGKFGIPRNHFTAGGIAVTFFFVLSGFILVYAYHDRLKDWKQIRKYLFGRFARIWPLHFVCILIAIATARNFTRFEDSTGWLQLVNSLLLLQAWFSDRDWLFAYNGVSWSISNEAFFYALFPFFLPAVMCKRTSFRLVGGFAAVLTVLLGLHIAAQQNRFPSLDYFQIGHFNPVMRSLDFLLGMMAGAVFLRRQISTERPFQFWVDTVKEILVLACIFLTVYWVIDSKSMHRVTNEWWGSVLLGSWYRVEYPVLLFAVAVYVFGQSRGLISRVLGLRLFVYLGEISYAFYMIHFLVVRSIHLGHVSYGDLAGWPMVGLAFTISLALAILLHEFVENPARAVLLAWWDRNDAQRLFASKAPLIKTKAVLSIACAISLIVFINSKAVRYQRPAAVKSIVRQSDPKFKRIDFGSDIRLLGLVTEQQKKKLAIRFAWLKRVPLPHRRVVVVLNKKGNRVARAQHGQDAIIESLPGESFADIAYVPLELLDGRNEIVVYFREADGDSLTVERGQRRLRDTALVIPYPRQPQRNRRDKKKSPTQK